MSKTPRARSIRDLTKGKGGAANSALAKRRKAEAAGGIEAVRAKTLPFDPSEFLDTPEAIAAYLDDAMASGDAAIISDAIGVAAKALGFSRIAEVANVNRSALYRTLSEQGNPELSTLLRVLNALGVRLATAPIGVTGVQSTGEDVLTDLRKLEPPREFDLVYFDAQDPDHVLADADLKRLRLRGVPKAVVFVDSKAHRFADPEDVAWTNLQRNVPASPTEKPKGRIPRAPRQSSKA
jgi:probable addiction module antidote protein